jgi:hypothetical protein
MRVGAPTVFADVASAANSIGNPLDLWIATLRSR